MGSAAEEKILPQMAGVFYSEEGMQKASRYLESRGLDASKTLHPFTVGPSVPHKLRKFEKKIAMPFASQMVDRLYLPIVDPLDPKGKELIGFDCRYIATGKKSKDFVRWVKIKEPSRGAAQFTYGFREAAYNPHKPTVLTESILCAETIRQNFSDRVNAVCFCSSLKGVKAASLLAGLSSQIILAYDNDSGGMAATQNLMEKVAPMSEVTFIPLLYQGQDINAGYLSYGLEPLSDSLDMALEKFKSFQNSVSSFTVGQIGG